MPDASAKLHGARVMERLGRLAGPEPKAGVDRVVFTPGHRAARELLVAWGAEAGLAPSLDPVGNLWLLPEDPAPKLLLIGSHVDSVPGGGRFDGALGVVLGLEVAAAWASRGDRPGLVAVVDFAAEESSRFGVGTVGSSVFAGRRALAEALALRDPGGASFGECRADHAPGPATREAPAASAFGAYLEVHVDQATDLTELGAPLGIVDTIAAPTRWRVTIVGEAAHAGAAPMGSRRDALAAAAEVVLWVEESAKASRDGEVRATVGSLNVRPNVPNVVAGRTESVVDLRALGPGQATAFRGRLEARLRELERTRGVAAELEELMSDEPQPMHERTAAALSGAAAELGFEAPRVSSWAAHDAMHVAAVMPTAMLMVSNRGGVSHNPREEVGPEALTAAYAVLERAARRLCEGGLGSPAGEVREERGAQGEGRGTERSRHEQR